MREPEVTINGTRLTEAQAAAVRVAVAVFALDLSSLAPATLKDGYQAALRVVQGLIDDGPA